MNSNIQNYIDLIKSGEIISCKEQKQLCEYVEDCFKNEKIYVDEEQLEKYLDLQKYFDYDLFPWEKFVFALHNCTYKENGQLRWPVLVIYVGRGSGKNGFLAFEDFALLTPVNGVKNYNIDIFATAEDQAKTSFDDVYEVLENHKSKMEKHFRWNKESIKNLKTGSELRFRTSNANTKDGGRPGKVDFDEYHAYQNYKLINVATTGLGKKPHPRRTIITTDGDVRDGPLDKLLIKCRKILNREKADNGTLPFLCRLDSEEEINDKEMWIKAIPSLPYLDSLQTEIDIEYEEYLEDKLGNAAFATKRMNRPQGDKESEVTSWENILKTNQVIPDLTGCPCVAGIDYAKTTDFVAAGLLFFKDDKYYWITHTWVCRACVDLPRIQFPLDEAERRGLLEFVDDVEVDPSIPAEWIKAQKSKYRVLGVAIDLYRYTLLSKALKDVGFDANNPDRKKRNVYLVRPSNEMMISPTITRWFAKNLIIWDDNMLMRWYTNNSKMVMSPAGNITYGKIEPKSRKTDGFKAFVAAATISDQLDKFKGGKKRRILNVSTY